MVVMGIEDEMMTLCEQRSSVDQVGHLKTFARDVPVLAAHTLSHLNAKNAKQNRCPLQQRMGYDRGVKYSV